MPLTLNCGGKGPDLYFFPKYDVLGENGSKKGHQIHNLSLEWSKFVTLDTFLDGKSMVVFIF